MPADMSSTSSCDLTLLRIMSADNIKKSPLNSGSLLIGMKYVILLTHFPLKNDSTTLFFVIQNTRVSQSLVLACQQRPFDLPKLSQITLCSQGKSLAKIQSFIDSSHSITDHQASNSKNNNGTITTWKKISIFNMLSCD